MLNLDYYDDEFSTKHMLSNQPMYFTDENGFIIPEKFIINNSNLEVLMDLIVEGKGEISDSLNMTFLTNLVNSTLYCVPIDDGVTYIENMDGFKFFPFFTSRDEFFKTFPDIRELMSFSFYDFCEVLYENDGNMGFKGVRINPDSQDIFISPDMMVNLYEMFE